MSRISNKFYVQAIDDGTTLHAQLLSNKALTQAFIAGGSAVPDWTVEANRPTIYVDMLSGTDRVVPNSGGTWTYNGQVIDFENDTRFQLVTNYIPTGYSAPVPAIKIVANLASSTNVDTDTIGYSGSYSLGGTDLNFAVSTNIRITSTSAAGIFGLIEFVDGSNVVSEDGQTKIMRGRLFGADGVEIVASEQAQTPFTTQWLLNDAPIGAGGKVTSGSSSYYQAKSVSEEDITDNAIVACTFSYNDGSTDLTYTAYESLDDQTDPEQMYIQTSVSNGGTGLDGGGAELHKGQSVTFQIWMGTMTDSTPDTTWTSFKVRLHKSDGSVVLDSIPGIPDVVTGGDSPASADYGYRQMTWQSEYSYASIIFPYDLVKATFAKYLTGYVKAEKN